MYFESCSEVYFDDVQAMAQEFTITPNTNLKNFDELEEEFIKQLQITKF